MTDDADDPHDLFPDGFFSRSDESDDSDFYRPERLVTHIDDRAIGAVGDLYSELAISGSVLDLMSSWISHFQVAPKELVLLGMNERELRSNQMATGIVVHDLNKNPVLPFPDARFDAATCCVSIDYLVRPIDVLRECGRVVRPGGPVVCTFSNRCFPTKVIRGWLGLDEPGRCALVAEYMKLAGLTDIAWSLRTPRDGVRGMHGVHGDPLYAVVGRVGTVAC